MTTVLLEYTVSCYRCHVVLSDWGGGGGGGGYYRFDLYTHCFCHVLYVECVISHYECMPV